MNNIPIVIPTPFFVIPAKAGIQKADQAVRNIRIVRLDASFRWHDKGEVI